MLSLPFIVASTALAAQSSTGDQAGPTLEDLFTVKQIGSVRVSPAGDAILYTVTEADLEANERDADIWLVRRAGTGWDEPVQLTHHSENDGSPSWHPDGRSFAFLSSERPSDDAEGAGQKLYLMDLRGGEPREIYAHATSISAFAWSPDGSQIAFRAIDEETDDDKARKKNGTDISIEDDEGRFTHLWMVGADGTDARRVTEGHAYTVGPFSWSPDGARLAFSATPTGRPADSWKSDVYVVEVAGEGSAPTRVTNNPGPDQNPIWTPDGAHLIYSGVQSNRYEIGLDHVFRIPVAGGTPEDISPRADVAPGPYTLTADGRGAFFETTTGTTRGLFYMDLADRRPVRVTPDAGVYSGVAFSDDRRSIAYTFESPNSPGELFSASFSASGARSASADRPLTSHNTHAVDFAVGATEVLRWQSVDGRDVEGVVVYPAGWTEADGPRATVVKIHGGPSGVYVQNFQAASYGSDAQRYAADGYVVLLPNPRGSSGYGDEGLKAVVGDWGGLDFQDIMTGVDELIDRGIAHPDSLGVMGWSYGGYMTAWTVTQTSRFKAAIAGAAITENIAMWGTQDIQHVFEAYFGGGPYEPGMWDVYQKSNPLAFIDQATTPTMVIHGANDPRVPPNQALIFYRGLKANGVDSKLVWLPRSGHGPSEPGLQYETARNQKEWMDQWIRRRPTRPIS
ncbi:MAG: S9 family peptidase [Gemmatimonadetes bacterium]|nr:S9 family peptidase [Gemmatimonadota bacterium]